MALIRNDVGNVFFVPGALTYSMKLNEVGQAVFSPDGVAGVDGAKGDTGPPGTNGAAGAAGSGGGGGVVMPYLSGKWYSFPGQLLATLATAAVADSLTLSPFVPAISFTATDLAIFTITGVAAAKCRLAIYAANVTTRKPTGAALASTGDVSTVTSSTTTSGALNAPLAMVAGTQYYAAVLSSAANVYQGLNGHGDGGHSIIGGELTPPTDFLFSSLVRAGFRVDSTVYATGLPDVTSATFNSVANVCPCVLFKAQ